MNPTEPSKDPWEGLDPRGEPPTGIVERENEVDVYVPRSVAAEQKAAEAASQIQSALVIAKRFPRDEMQAETRIANACRRYSLAKGANYSFPRGGQKVTGPSIRLAETLAQAWGNLTYGFNELEQLDGRSTVEAFCHDLETNTRVSRTFTVHHKITLKDKSEKILRDPRDIYEIVANNAQRRVRAAIIEILPGDVVEKAVALCRKTLALGEKAEPLIDRVKRVVLAFADLGVSKELLEQNLGHDIEATTAEEIVDLQEIYNSLKDGMTKRQDWFDFGGKASAEGGKAAELNAKLKEAKKS